MSLIFRVYLDSVINFLCKFEAKKVDLWQRSEAGKWKAGFEKPAREWEKDGKAHAQ